jgi:hypothetical protein
VDPGNECAAALLTAYGFCCSARSWYVLMLGEYEYAPAPMR